MAAKECTIYMDGSVLKLTFSGTAADGFLFEDCLAQAKKLGPRKDVEALCAWISERGLKVLT